MQNQHKCYHCGDDCTESIVSDDKYFCCNGCKQIYLFLNENNLCNYYNLDDNPGIKAKGKFTGNKFSYLDDEDVINKLVLFRSESRVNVQFSLPQIHCSSCIFLLEKLHEIEEGVIQSRVNFQQKNIFISYDPAKISLRKVVELISFIGYEPDISLQDTLNVNKKKRNYRSIIEIGVAGFCFSNIMMMSFPEYFSGGYIEQYGLQKTFSWIILFLSLPVLFYSASSIFKSAAYGLRQREINIDAPIALAIIITFSRSYYEIITGNGAGYLDSGTGIIFFMLIGRWFQGKTYESLSFDRKYQSYFPLGVTIQKDGTEKNIPITKLLVNDIILTRNNEMIPADAILLSNDANVDYSFVNGENATQHKVAGEMLYAGGKQIGKSILLRAVKLPSQSYITDLWNNSVFEKNKEQEDSFIHPWSRYFTLGLFTVAMLAGIYWSINDTSKLLNVITSVLIVACPCSLLLTSTFTFGNMLRITGKHKLFLKNATVIESLAKIKHIVFDKTGTITSQERSFIQYNGMELSPSEKLMIKYTTAQSSHILSRTVHDYLKRSNDDAILVAEPEDFEEIQGKGIKAANKEMSLQLGSAVFAKIPSQQNTNESSEIHVNINNNYKGFFEIKHPYREGIDQMLQELSKNYQLHVLSGDNDAERNNLQKLFGKNVPLSFYVSPKEKLDYIKNLQQNGDTVMMIGDGLNDAGALMQAEVGIAVSDNSANFSPACDGIIDGNELKNVSVLMRYARSGKKLVSAGFALSIVYNIVGLSFAVQGKLAPVVAAVLMPISSISIVLFAMLITSVAARKFGLK